MEQPPSVDEVVACIATLYHDPNPEKKTGANQWLQILQNSVFAWRVRQFFKVLNHRLDRFFCLDFIVKYTFDARKCCLLFVSPKKSVVANLAKFGFCKEGETLFDIISKLQINDFILSFTFESRNFVYFLFFSKKQWLKVLQNSVCA